MGISMNNYSMGPPDRDAHDGEMVAIDLEISGMPEGKLHRPVGKFEIMTISMEHGGDFAITDSHDVPEALRRIKKGIWTFHNATFDLTQLKRIVDIPERFIWDVMLVEKVLWNGYYDDFSLADISRRYLDHYMDKEIRESFINMTGDVTKEQLDYAIDDTRSTLRDALEQKKLLTPQTMSVYENIDAPMIWCVLEMPPAKVNVDAWIKTDLEHQRLAREYEDDLGFNVFAYAKVKQILNRAGYAVKSTGGDLLEAFLPDPFIEKIILARRYRKAVSTYGADWIDKHIEGDGFVWSNWLITGAATGRMASRDPNLQNIPARKLPIYRTFFIPTHKNGFLIVSDVSQQESRIMAFMSKDKALLEAFVNDEDIHQFVADRIQRDRSIGKAINLGSQYGLTPYGLADKIHVSTREAEEILGTYFNRFKGVHNWIGRTRTNSRVDGYVTTASGRIAYINHFNERQWDKQAINYPIQGGASDHTKMSVNLNRIKSKEAGLPFAVSMIVHDETVLDCMPGTKRKYSKIANDSWIETADQLFPGIPFKADTKIGDTWAVGKEK